MTRNQRNGEIVRLYVEELWEPAVIGRAFNLTSAHVSTIIQAAGLRRTRSEAATLRFVRRPLLRTTHGQSNSPTHRSWIEMRRRCRARPNRPDYHLYGGLGIRVCERWDVFENFLADMGERPVGKTLDRIDPTGDYEPSNCRWATPKEQRMNRRPRVRS